MEPRTRIALVALLPLLAAAALLAGRSAGGDAVGAEPAAELASSRTWLALIGGAYLVNYAIAWPTRRSWTSALVRSLLWAVVAFIAVSELVDLVGEDRGIVGRAFGLAEGADPAVAAAERWLLLNWVLCLVAAGLGIGVGFEGGASEESAGPGDEGASGER